MFRGEIKESVKRVNLRISKKQGEHMKYSFSRKKDGRHQKQVG